MITVQGLTKRYRGVTAVDDLSFTVRPGVVTGFLGPNGAGKSTTMRLMLGLERGSGSATFGGRTYAELANPLRTVGALLDAKAVHPARTACNHLRMVAAGAGIPTQRVREVLSLVGLDDVRHRRIGGFSLGMHQRLGLATAMLGDPEYLILDEPANGLDPEGVHWMRTFLRGLASEGRVVLTSSHLLSEISMTADELVVIGQGRLIASRPTRDFVDTYTRSEVVVRTPQAAEFEMRLRQAGLRARCEEPEVVVVTGVDADVVSARAAQSGVRVRELHTRRSSLEDAFLAATSNATQYRGEAA
ncbi:ABC-2 type transport system ATP-binding protein [Saccharopolyspora erythraea NRRL 2338]|nr:ATP-binding cassette domain-containing protein [Saccharopolyspora erythraea]EQD83446.1 ABC transporter ATP-binding protein [Saccharopolyspora erythraea D]PFG99436.1 ABC-2 type transport system ATP-binding protein [Saccharopolyspora erythraea NRRL 2338]QRK89346.1 ATP-binding cassette domain-containing protein [Saccharopolyspora erythraea]